MTWISPSLLAGIKLARHVADKLNGAFYPLDLERETGRVVLMRQDGARIILDIATYRGADIEADLRDRDFTIQRDCIQSKH